MSGSEEPADRLPPSGARRTLVRVLLGLAVAAVPATALVWLWRATAEQTVVPVVGAADVAAPAALSIPWPSAGTGQAPAPAGPAVPPATTSAGVPLQVAVSYRGDVSQVPSEARVYVFVRPTGERMPLGVERLTMDELPTRVTFAGLDPAASVEVVARLSRSGNVTLDPGDLEVVASAADAPTGGALELVLGRE